LPDVLAALSDQLGIPLVTVDAPRPALPRSTLTLAMADTLDFETVAAVRPSLVAVRGSGWCA
jgi:hypothetical protein